MCHPWDTTQLRTALARGSTELGMLRRAQSKDKKRKDHCHRPERAGTDPADFQEAPAPHSVLLLPCRSRNPNCPG